jgi:predicted N-acyltransferase
VSLTVRIVPDLAGVSRASWDALDHGGSPFLEHGFLRALEETGSVGPGTGWEPHYVLALDAAAAGALVGAVVCFRKDHSYGEYIFDFGWARAAARAGIAYYPKLVVAAPHTPATGPRILLAPARAGRPDPDEIARTLVAAVRDLSDRLRCSSIHWLFVTEREQALLAQMGFVPRTTFQFHFANPGYADFDAFLAELQSRKRKQIRKERARAREAVDAIEFVAGRDLVRADLDALDRFYRITTREHGGTEYLRRGFFHALHEHMPERMVMARARRSDRTIAGALYLETDCALYGRYWGASETVPFLHFEVACYQGIERCIARGLPRFEAGAQGEHKLLRGFAPTPTLSAHWIRHAGLRDAVERFLREEAVDVRGYMDELERFTPFRAGE